MNLIGHWADRCGQTARVLDHVLLRDGTHPDVHQSASRALCGGIAVTTLFMVCMSGRAVPAMAMITASVKARYRGGFMSANSSVQQFSMGLATYVSGQIMGQTPQGELTHFPLIGLLSVLCTFAGIYLVALSQVRRGRPTRARCAGHGGAHVSAGFSDAPFPIFAP
jgi:MFS transporter, DHA1 family, inner membrane transport protein